MFNVKALPKNLSLIGDFKLKSTLNKTQLKQNEALSYKIVMEGFGNLEDLQDIKLDIKNTTIYENKALHTKELKEGKYYRTYSKTFSILANKDFIIPSYELKYFNQKNNTIEIIKSKEYSIKVKENKLIKDNKLEKKIMATSLISTSKIKQKNNRYLFYVLFFFLGVFLTLLFIVFYRLFKKKKTIETSLYKKIKSASSKNVLLNILAAYITKDPALDEKIYELEKGEAGEFFHKKKEILVLIKNLDKKGIL